MFSVMKLNDKPSYKLAREGKAVKRQSNLVAIFKFENENLFVNGVDFCIYAARGRKLGPLPMALVECSDVGRSSRHCGLQTLRNF